MTLLKLSQFKRRLAPPAFDDPAKTEQARLQNIIFLGTLAIALFFGLMTWLLEPDPWLRLLLTGLWFVAAGGGLFLMRRGKVKQAGLFFSIFAWLILTFDAWLAGSVLSAGFTNYTVIILLIGMLAGFRAAFIFAGLSALSGLGLLYVEANRMLPVPLISASPAPIWAALTSNFIAAAVLLYLANRNIAAALERARTNEVALRESNRELEAARHVAEEWGEELTTAVELLEIQLTERQQLANALQHSEAELRRLNLELEQRVREKTAELTETNEALSQEIAVRRQAEAALQETFQMIKRAKQEWEVTVDALPQLVCLIDRQGRVKRTNRTVERWGLAPVAGVKDRTVGELLHPDCDDPACELKQFWRQAFEGLRQGRPAEYELEDARLERSIRCQVQPIVAVSPGRSQPLDSLGVLVVHDITDQKRAEQALRESQERLELAVTGTGGALWDEALDPEATFEEMAGAAYLSPEEKRLLGYPEDEAAQLPPAMSVWDEHVLPEDRALREQNQRDHFEGRTEILDHEYRIRRVDGAVRWIQGRSRIIRDAQGRPIRWIGIDWDVTDRKGAEEELRNLSSAVEQSPSTVVITDVKGRIEFVNPRFSRVTGYDRAEVIGQNPRLLKSDQHPPEFYRELWQTILASQTWRGEIVNRTKTGDLYWELASIAPIRDQAGQITHFVKVSEDITQRKQAEEALRKSEEQYRFLVNNTSDYIARFDRTGVLLLASERASTFHGYEPDEIENTSSFERIHPDDRAKLQRLLEQVIETGEDGRAEFRLKRGDGGYLWAETIVRRVYNEAGEPEVIAVQRDITERKQAEEALRESETRYRTLVEASPDSITLADLTGNIITCNQQTAALLGYERAEELIGRNISELFPPDELPRMQAGIQQTLAQGVIQNVEYTMLKQDGLTIPVEVNGALISDEAGQPQAFVSIARDITERKRLEVALQESEARYRTISELTSDYAYSVRVEPDGRITSEWYSEAFKRVSGLEGDGTAHEVGHTIYPEDQPIFEQRLARLLTGEPAIDEYRIIAKTGETRWLRDYARPEWDESQGRAVRIVGAAQDITGRKQAEEALRKSEEQYRFLVNNTSDYIARFDRNGMLLFGTEVIRSVTGYEQEEIVHTSGFERVHPDDREKLGRVLESVIETGEDGRVELRTKHKEGGYLWADLSLRRAYNEAGEPELIMVGRNITERKQAERELARYRDHLEELVNERTAQLNQANQKLQQSEENFRALADNAQDGFLIVARDEKFVYTNRRAAEMTGYPLAELQQLSTKELVHPNEYEKVSNRHRRRLAGEEVSNQHETIVVCKNGQPLSVEITAAKTSWSGQVADVVSLRDITERKRAEARYRALFEQAPAMYVVARTEDGSPVVADCNNLFLSTLGYRRDEVIGRSLGEFYTPESRISLMAGGLQRAMAGTFESEERRLVTAAGQVIDTLLRAEPETDAAGNVIGTRAMYLDISQRKQAETELRQRNQELQTLQAASAAISSTLDLDHILSTVTREITSLLGMESCYFSMWDQAGDTLYQIATYAPGGWRGEEPEPELYHLVDYPLTRQVLAEQRAVQLTLSRPDVDPAERAYMEEARIKTYVMVPMVYQEQPIGLVDIEDSRLEQTFSDRQIGVVEALVDQAVVAMQNARLYEQAQEEIAERRRVEQELRLSEERFRQVVTSITDHIYVTEIIPGGEHLNLYLSPNVELLTGYPPERFLADWDLWANEIIHPEDRAAAAAQLTELDRSQSSEMEYRLTRQDGQVIWVRDSARVEMRDNAKIIYGVINDITARKEAEVALVRYSERLEILRQIEHGILSAQSVVEIGQAAINRIRSLIPCHTATIMTFDYVAQEAILITGFGQPGEQIRVRLPEPGLTEAAFKALKEGQVVILDEAELERHHLGARGRIRLMLVAPLLYQTELMGTLNLSANEAGAFTPEHQEIAAQVAGQLAIAIRQADLHEQIQRHAAELEVRVASRTRELSALYEVAAVANKLQSLESMLAQCLKEALAAVESRAGLIFLKDEVTQTFKLTSQQGIAPQALSQAARLLRDEGILAAVIEQGRPVIISNLTDRYPSLPELAAENLAGYIGVLIRAAGQPIGILNIFSDPARQFNVEELALLTTIADQIGVAVESARLRQQAEEAAVMAERDRLARDLHDSVTQSLYSLTLFSESSLELIKGGQIDMVEHNLSRIGQTAQQALREMRMMVYELRPVDLEKKGLIGVLHQRLQAVEKRTGLNARLVAEQYVELPLAVEQELYWVVQEALNNVIKHAGVANVSIHFRVDGQKLLLEIVDDGRGFNPDAAGEQGGLGLNSMRARVKKLGGSLDIYSAPHEGTMIHVEIEGYGSGGPAEAERTRLSRSKFEE